MIDNEKAQRVLEVQKRLGCSMEAITIIGAAIDHALLAVAPKRHCPAGLLMLHLRTCALRAFGFLAGPTLERMGLVTNADVGRIVWALCDADLLQREATDRIEDFDEAPHLMSALEVGARAQIEKLALEPVWRRSR